MMSLQSKSHKGYPSDVCLVVCVCVSHSRRSAGLIEFLRPQGAESIATIKLPEEEARLRDRRSFGFDVFGDVFGHALPEIIGLSRLRGWRPERVTMKMGECPRLSGFQHDFWVTKALNRSSTHHGYVHHPLQFWTDTLMGRIRALVHHNFAWLCDVPRIGHDMTCSQNIVKPCEAFQRES